MRMQRGAGTAARLQVGTRAWLRKRQGRQCRPPTLTVTKLRVCFVQDPLPAGCLHSPTHFKLLCHSSCCIAASVFHLASLHCACNTGAVCSQVTGCNCIQPG